MTKKKKKLSRSFNFFNYLSLDTIKQLLKRAMTWLRPGGVVLFTYNNADMSPSAGLSEGYFMTYVPKSLLIPLVESLGYEVIASRDFDPSTSWIEIKKAGSGRYLFRTCFVCGWGDLNSHDIAATST